MNTPTTATGHRTGSLYGAFAFGSIVLSCYAGFFSRQRHFNESEWMVIMVFVLGAVYVALGILSGTFLEKRGKLARSLYYVIQCILLTGIIWMSPIRGFFGLMVLPVMSQAIFDLRPRYAVLVGLYLFGLSIAIWAVPYGLRGAGEATISYFTAFAFTTAFTIITKQALNAREREEKSRRELEIANQLLREHAAQTEDLAVTRERNRLAREIHDGLGHYLTVIKTQLDAATALLPADPTRARDSVAKAANLTAEALDDVRRSVGSLRTDATRPPLPDSLRQLADTTGLPVTVRVEGNSRPLPPGIEHALFRAAQEGLTNIRKHAAASAAEIELDFRTHGGVVLSVTDNGKGEKSPAASAGFGLVGVRERIEVLGGRVVSGNRPLGGFALTIEVPA